MSGAAKIHKPASDFDAQKGTASQPDSTKPSNNHAKEGLKRLRRIRLELGIRCSWRKCSDARDKATEMVAQAYCTLTQSVGQKIDPNSRIAIAAGGRNPRFRARPDVCMTLALPLLIEAIRALAVADAAIDEYACGVAELMAPERNED